MFVCPSCLKMRRANVNGRLSGPTDIYLTGGLKFFNTCGIIKAYLTARLLYKFLKYIAAVENCGFLELEQALIFCNSLAL